MVIPLKMKLLALGCVTAAAIDLDRHQRNTDLCVLFETQIKYALDYLGNAGTIDHATGECTVSANAIGWLKLHVLS